MKKLTLILIMLGGLSFYACDSKRSTEGTNGQEDMGANENTTSGNADVSDTTDTTGSGTE